MRNSDTECQGHCYTHGQWAVKVGVVHTSESLIVADECPVCGGIDHETAVDQSFDEGWEAAEDDQSGPV